MQSRQGQRETPGQRYRMNRAVRRIASSPAGVIATRKPSRPLAARSSGAARCSLSSGSRPWSSCSPSFRPLGIGLAILGILVTIERLYVLPQNIRSWDTGGQGERLTAICIEPLRDEGFVILHDRAIPGTVANIDHIIIGPTGVWVIETKNYGGRIWIRDGELRVNGRRRTGVRDEVEREIAAVIRVAGSATVRGLLSSTGPSSHGSAL